MKLLPKLPNMSLKKKPPPSWTQTHPDGQPSDATALPPMYGRAAEAAAFAHCAGRSTLAVPEGQVVPPALPSANALEARNTTGAAGAAQHARRRDSYRDDVSGSSSDP